MTTGIGLAVGLIVGFWGVYLGAGILRRRSARNAQGQQIHQFVRRNGPTPLAEFTAEDGPELDAIVHQLHKQGRISTRTKAGTVIVFPNRDEGDQ